MMHGHFLIFHIMFYIFPITFIIFHTVFNEYPLVLVLNRMSNKLKSVTKKLFGGKSRVGTADTLFQGCSTATSRRAEIMRHIDLSLVGRTVCFQREPQRYWFSPDALAPSLFRCGFCGSWTTRMITYNFVSFGLQVLLGRYPRRRDSVMEKTRSTDTALMGMSTSLNAW
jgi:hypothetical protein